MASSIPSIRPSGQPDVGKHQLNVIGAFHYHNGFGGVLRFQNPESRFFEDVGADHPDQSFVLDHRIVVRFASPNARSSMNELAKRPTDRMVHRNDRNVPKSVFAWANVRLTEIQRRSCRGSVSRLG